MPHLSNRLPFVLCATLVQSPANLGSLCRTAEIFRLAELVLPSATVIDHWDFRRLAVSAQRWQPFSVCSPPQLPGWIKRRQRSGDSVYALTVSSQGIALPQVTFSKRTVAILGRELTGIPAEIEALCDRAVTIPQLGQVESLNVATAGAIAAYEYVRQRDQASRGDR